MALKWQEAFSVGHQELDGEHQRLLDTINAIDAAETDGAHGRVRSLSKSLHLMAMEHFRHENALMCDIIAGAYPVRADQFSETLANEHRAEHARALIALERILHPDDHGDGVKLGFRLMNWFVSHATDHDAQLRTWFQPK